MQGNFEKSTDTGIEFRALEARFVDLVTINEKCNWESVMHMPVEGSNSFHSQNWSLLEELLAFKSRIEEETPPSGFINDVRKMIICLLVVLGKMSNTPSCLYFFNHALENLQYYRNKLAYDNDVNFYQTLYQLFVNIMNDEVRKEDIELLWGYIHRYEAISDSSAWALLLSGFECSLLCAFAATCIEDYNPEFIGKIFDKTLQLHSKLKARPAKTPVEEAQRALFLASNCECQIFMYEYHHRKLLEAENPEALKAHILSLGKMLLPSMKQIYRVMENCQPMLDPLLLDKLFRKTIDISLNTMDKMLKSLNVQPSREFLKVVTGNYQFLLTIFTFFQKHSASASIEIFSTRIALLRDEIARIDHSLQQAEKDNAFQSLVQRLCNEGKYQQVFEKIQLSFQEIKAYEWDMQFIRNKEDEIAMAKKLNPLRAGLKILRDATMHSGQKFHSDMIKIDAYIRMFIAKIMYEKEIPEIVMRLLTEAAHLLKEGAGVIALPMDPLFYEILLKFDMIEKLDADSFWIAETMINYVSREPVSRDFSINLERNITYLHGILLILKIQDDLSREKVSEIFPKYIQFLTEVQQLPIRNFLERIQLACILSEYSCFHKKIQALGFTEIPKDMHGEPLLADPISCMEKIYELLHVSKEVQKKMRNSTKASILWKLAFQKLLSCSYVEFNALLQDNKEAHSVLFFEKAVRGRKLLNNILSIAKNLFADETTTSNYSQLNQLFSTLSLKIDQHSNVTAKLLIAEEDQRNKQQAEKDREMALKKATNPDLVLEKKTMKPRSFTPDNNRRIPEDQRITMENLLDLGLYRAGKYTAALENYNKCLILAEKLGDRHFQIRARSYMADILWKRFAAQLMPLSSSIEQKMQSRRILARNILDQLNRCVEETCQSVEYKQLCEIYHFNLSLQGEKGYYEYADSLILIEEIIKNINKTFLHIRKNMHELNMQFLEKEQPSSKCTFFSEPLSDRKAFPDIQNKKYAGSGTTRAKQDPAKNLKRKNDKASQVLPLPLPASVESDETLLTQQTKTSCSVQALMADLIKRPDRTVKTGLPAELSVFFEKLKPLSGVLLMTGSTVTNFYQKKNFSRNDVDFVLIVDEADRLETSRQLMSLTFVKNEVIQSDSWGLWSTWLQNSKGKWMPVDVVFVTKTENWLASFTEKQDFTTALVLDAEGIIYDLSGQAFRHLAEKKVQIVGNPSERLSQDPVLLLRIIDRFLGGSDIEETTQIAMQGWKPNGSQPSTEAHINATMNKYLKKWNNEAFIRVMRDYGLLNKMFEITHWGNWEETLEKVKSRIAKTAPDYLREEEFAEIASMDL